MFAKNFLAVASLSFAASVVWAAADPAKVGGGILVDAKGMTLYTFDKDTPGNGHSVCNGQCAALWPPLVMAAGDRPHGDYSDVTRDDGSHQWAFHGKPLHLYAGDQAPGDKTGDNFKEIWHVIRP